MTTKVTSSVLSLSDIVYTGNLTTSATNSIINIGSGQFYKSNTGNVAIGKTNPAYLLDVNGTISANSFVATANVSASNFIGSGSGLTSIPNSALVNTSITINGTTIPLGGSTTISAGATITDDITTNATRYLMLGSTTSGSYTSANTSSTKLTYNPSTGTLTSTALSTSTTSLNGGVTVAATSGQVLLTANTGQGSYNPIVQSGDQLLMFNSGARDTGVLSIAPWSITAFGLRMVQSTSTATLTGTLAATVFAGSGTGLTSIPNSSLSNSSITINGTAISLGSSGSISAGATITDDTTTNATRYLMLGSTTSGSYTSANTSSTKLSYNPSTGTLSSTVFAGSGTGLTSIPNSSLSNSSITINGSSVSLGGSTTISAGATITDDTTTNATRYVMLGTATSGSYTIANTSSSKLYFNPSTGTTYSTLFQSLSDETQKTNLTPIVNATDTINQINGYEFNWINNGEKSSGVIAQQLEKILPWLVSENDGVKSVNYSGLIAYLIQSNKELADRIEKLESK